MGKCSVCAYIISLLPYLSVPVQTYQVSMYNLRDSRLEFVEPFSVRIVAPTSNMHGACTTRMLPLEHWEILLEIQTALVV